MSHLNPGLISAYNSLTDKHLAGYFSSTRIRRHLQRAGLITRSGRIVPDKEYRNKLIQRAHQRHVRECLAQAIFHKVLDMERVHQTEIKRRLEEFARRERVQKIKLERSKRYEEDLIRILSPRPPTGARGIRKQHSGPEGEHSESSESPGSSRPNTAPGKMQRPVRLKPIHSNSTTASLRRSSPYRLLESSNENDQLFNGTMDKECRRRWTTKEASHGISPYCLPVINNFVTPVPPAAKRKERGVKVTLSGTLRGRRLRPTTASSGADVNEDSPMLRSSVHQSRVCVNMMYFGKTVHLSHDLTDMRDEVKVFQQHCGGENLCVYKGLLREGETFQFISRRHRGFPFSLTFFLNGLQVERLSSCCEFKHRRGSRLGGRHGHFGFSSVEGASPCYKCIIAVGLDKKPTPPPKRVKEDGRREESGISPKDAPEMRAETTGEEAASHSEYETMETQVKEETRAEEDKVRDDYEEDFEADDEGPAEDEEKKSPSPSRERQRQVKERDTSETEDDEKDDIKSRSGSSSSGSDREESDAEDSREDEKAEQAKEVDEEETVVPPDEKDEPFPEEAAATEAESAVAKDSDIQNNDGDSKEIDISDTSVPTGKENKPSDDTSGDREAEKTVDESKQEEEEEQDRAISVQETQAEESQLSNTSTEEEKKEKSHEQDNKDAVPEKSVTFTELQHTLVQEEEEETKCEEDAVGEAEVVVQNQDETSDPKEQEDVTEQEPNQSRDSTKDEEDEKAAPEENTAENDKLDDTADAGLHPVSEGEVAEGDKTSEPQEDAAAKPTDAAEKDEEKTAVEADTHPDETGQGAKSREEDESLASEPNKKTDETAVADNAEAEAMAASETMEMKAEPSEEREALSCEEGPVTNTERRQLGDSEGRVAESEREITAENSSSSLEGSGDTTVEKTAETSEGNVKDESNKDDIKKEEASAVEARKDENQQERFDLGEEQTEKSVERDDNIEEKSEEEGKEEEKQIKPDEIAEGDNNEEREADDREKTEEENNENKTEERVESTENISKLTKTDSSTEGKADEQAEKTHSEEDTVASEEKTDESEKTEKDEDSERVKNENDVEECEEKGADKTNEGEKINETSTAADDEQDDEAEKSQNENKAERSEAAMSEDGKEREEKKVVEREEISEPAEEPERSADADLGKDNVKISDENAVESEDVSGSEAANVAQETLSTEEMLNNKVEAEDAKNEAERGSKNSENRGIDAENGEISTAAENKTREDEVEAQSEGKNDEKTAERREDEIKTEGPTEDKSAEVQEVKVESEDGAEKHEEKGKVDQTPEGDVGSGATEAEEKQDESPKKNSEPETCDMEIQEESDDRKDSEETKQDEKDKISDAEHENRDSDLTEKNDNVQSDVNEVIAASSGDQEQSSAPVAVDLDDTAHKLDQPTAPSYVNTDKRPRDDENAAAVDLAAADGEQGDTEEMSKASEEGASVLLKPQGQSSQNNEAENTGESAAVGKETPEALAREDSTDLVSNWVSKHQTSKFFETFVEPLEDLKESDVHVSNSSEEASGSTELPRSASPLKMGEMFENVEQEQTTKAVNESREKNKEEAVESEPGSSEGGEPCEESPVEDTLQEEMAVKDLVPEAESEQNDKESVKERLEEHKGSRGSLEEDGVEEGLMQDNTEITVMAKTEVESIAGTHHSGASGRPESFSENQTEEKTTGNGPDANEKQTIAEEMMDLLRSSEKEERSMSPEGLSELTANELKDTEKSCGKSRELTEITAFTASKSDDGSQEEPHRKDTEPKPSDESVNGDRRDVQLIRGLQHTLSKDRLSTFLVDETLFGRSSYPLLAAARTESGH
ncbi:glutamate-rich protein 3 [Chelmon rostratus]|uniref:glutamate-rich protein 3 n=1 Tax=Chelmon rostratus TaxID=109905 RepID=UPI001BE9073D|nr:glutamate-rich protein 3 [Chelmon rostratus]